MIRRPCHLILPVLVLAVPLLGAGCASTPTTTGSGETTFQSGSREAEAVIREVVEAMYMKDRGTIERLTLPTPGLDRLWSGPEPRPFEISRFMEELEDIQIRPVGAGETISMPGGVQVAATHDMTTGDRRVFRVLLPGARSDLPFILERVRGQWRVDPAPLLSGR